MPSRKIVSLLFIAVLALGSTAAERPGFIAFYVPQYVVTYLDTGNMKSPGFGFAGGGFNGRYLIEADVSSDVSLIQGLISDKDRDIDGGLMDVRWGMPVGGDNPAFGAGLALDIHTLSALDKGGWTGIGPFVFSSLALEERLYLLPKVGWVKTGFGDDADMSSYLFLECGIGFRVGGGFGITVQPSYDIRFPRVGSANRFALRFGLGWFTH